MMYFKRGTFAVVCALASCGEGNGADRDVGYSWMPPLPGGSSESGDGSTSEAEPATVCGDGVEAAPEVCDDGPENGSYGHCNGVCTGPGPYCGDGVVSGPEACDDGNDDDSDSCNAQCAPTSCGDGIVQPPEVCDDGRNGDPDDGCTDSCAFPVCGDGLIQASLGEACDDSNAVPEDGCELDCTATTKTVFVTSQKFPSTFGGVLFADEFCSSAASFAGLAGTYRAWLGDGVLRPATRFNISMNPYTLVDGTVVADDFLDLTDGVLHHAINRDEFGLLVPEGLRVWTGVGADGYTSISHCKKWGVCDDIACTATSGRAWMTSNDWSGAVSSCAFPNALYCFEQ